jgi:hypothetical protein
VRSDTTTNPPRLVLTDCRTPSCVTFHCALFLFTLIGSTGPAVPVEKTAVKVDEPPPVWTLTKCQTPVAPSGQLIPSWCSCRPAACARPMATVKATKAIVAVNAAKTLLIRFPLPPLVAHPSGFPRSELTLTPKRMWCPGGIPNATGSIRTPKNYNGYSSRGVSSVGRAPALQAGGRRFEPGTLHSFASAIPRERNPAARILPFGGHVPEAGRSTPRQIRSLMACNSPLRYPR